MSSCPHSRECETVLSTYDSPMNHDAVCVMQPHASVATFDKQLACFVLSYLYIVH